MSHTLISFLEVLRSPQPTHEKRRELFKFIDKTTTIVSSIGGFSLVKESILKYTQRLFLVIFSGSALHSRIYYMLWCNLADEGIAPVSGSRETAC